MKKVLSLIGISILTAITTTTVLAYRDGNENLAGDIQDSIPSVPNPDSLAQKKVDLKFKVYFPDDYEDADTDGEWQQYYFSNIGATLYSPDDGPGAESSVHVATVEPNKKYIFWIRGSETNKLPPDDSDIIDLDIRFHQVQGYDIHIDGERREYIADPVTASQGWASYAVILLPNGVATAQYNEQDVIQLAFPLGASPAAVGLGAVTIRIEGTGSNQVLRTHLNLVDDELHGLTSTYSSGLSQVDAPQFQIKFTDITNGFKVTYYALEHSTGSTYSYSTHPIMEHKVENFSSNTHIRHTFSRFNGSGGSAVQVRRTDYYWNNAYAWDREDEELATEGVSFEVDTVTNTYGGNRAEEITVSDSVSTATKVRKAYKYFNSEERTYKDIEIIDGEEWVTTYDYYENVSGQPQKDGSLKKIITPEGNEIEYDYKPFVEGSDAFFGQLAQITSAWENSVGDKVVKFGYSKDWNGRYSLTQSKIVTHEGTPIKSLSKQYFSYKFSNPDIPRFYKLNGMEVLITTTEDLYGTQDEEDIQTVRATYRRDQTSDYAGKLIFESFPNGSMTYYEYDEISVSLDSNERYSSHNDSETGGWKETVYTGATTDQSDGSKSIGISNYSKTFYPSYRQSTAKRIFRDPRGLIVREEALVYDGTTWSQSNWKVMSWKDFVYNEAGQLTEVFASYAKDSSGNDVAVYEASYNSKGQLEWFVSEDGTKTTFTYDALSRPLTTAEESVSATGSSLGLAFSGTVSIPARTVTTDYDAAGRVLTKTISSGGESLVESREYYESGRLEEEVGVNGTGKNYSYNLPSGSTGAQTVVKRVETDGNLETNATTTTYNKDGSIEKVEGCGTCGHVDKYYSYNPYDFYVETITSIGDDSLTRYTIEEVDSFGRLLYRAKTAYGAGNFFEESFVYAGESAPTGHKNKGYLLYKSETDLADRHYDYDDMGNLTMEWLDLDDDSSADPISDELILLYEVEFQLVGTDEWWRVSTTRAPYVDSNGTGTATFNEGIWDPSNDRILSISASRISGHANEVFSEGYTSDAAGNYTWSRLKVKQATNLQIQEIDYPDVNDRPSSTSFNSVDTSQFSMNGKVVATSHPDGSEQVLFYDGLHRADEVWDRTLGYQFTKYVSSKTLVDYVTQFKATAGSSGNKQVEYEYDLHNRVKEEKSLLDAGTSANKTTYFAYDDYDRLTNVWGETNPIKYEYHSTYGHMSKQYTYRDGSGWTLSTWPTSPGTADVTEFFVDDRSGLLTKKIAPDSPPVPNEVFTEYSYTKRGQIDVVTNIRTGSSVDYTYDSDTGLLSSEDLSDTEGIEITYSYNRFGMLKQVTDDMGTRDFKFAVDSDELLVPSEEHLDGTYYKGWDIDSTYYSGTLSDGEKYGKLKSVLVKNSSGTTQVENIYGYDTLGRLSTIDLEGSNYTTTYTYENNTSYISKRSTDGVVEENRTRLANTYLTQTVTNNLINGGTTQIAKFHYLFDDGRRKIREFKEGSVFDDYCSYGLVRKYTYSDKGELTLTEDYLNNSSTYTTSNGSTRTKGRYWSWAFDNQGNRSGTNGYEFGDYWAQQTSNYTTNVNNQYTLRTVPGWADLGGHHVNANSVHFWHNGAYSHKAAVQGTYFWEKETPSTSSGAVSGLIEAKDVSNGNALVADKLYALAETEAPGLTEEAMSYDEDGNLIEDGLWNYTYNAKNQLISMESKGVVSQDGFYIVIDLLYDYLGRCSEKVVYEHTGDPLNLTTLYTQAYIYNGWNVMAVIHDEGSPGGAIDTIGYTWGLDLSGSLGGAGGVGGLVAIEDERTGGTYSVAQDGNGNIAAVVDLSTKAIVAEFEYSPYGRIIREAGSYAVNMPYRFSTKWYDKNSDLYYYGFRFYDPENGKFINRDPLGESGGTNLYAFVGNDPVNFIDAFGLAKTAPKLGNYHCSTKAGKMDPNCKDPDEESPVFNLLPHPVYTSSPAVGNAGGITVISNPIQIAALGVLGNLTPKGGRNSGSGSSSDTVQGEDAERRKLCEGYANNIANLQAQRRNAVAKADSIYGQRDRLNELYRQQETSITGASVQYADDLIKLGISLVSIPGADLSSGTLSLFDPSGNVIEKSFGAIAVTTGAGKLAGTFSPSVAFARFNIYTAIGAFAIDYGSEIAPIVISNMHQSRISQDYTERASDVMNKEVQGIWEAEKIYQDLYDENNCQDFE